MLEISTLNHLIKELQLTELDTQGFSCTLVENNPLYLYKSTQGLLVYYFTQKLNESDLHNHQLLLKLLEFNAPAAKYQNLKVGIDKSNKILWISSFIKNDDLTADVFGDFYKDFIEHAFALKDDLIRCLASSATLNETSANDLNNDILDSFKANMLLL